MDNFKPKSLEELDCEFVSAVRELNSGEQEKEESDVSAQPAVKPEAQRESLLPKPVFYKAAPMQADLPAAERHRPSYDESIRINVPAVTDSTVSDSREEEEYSQYKAQGKSTVRALAKAAVSVMLVLTVMFSGFMAGIVYLCNNSKREVLGYHLYPVLLTTLSPALKRGDLVSVKAMDKSQLDAGVIIVYLDSQTEEYRCAVVESAVSDGENEITVTASYIDSYSKKLSVQTEWKTVQGMAVFYLPYCLHLYNFVTAHLAVCVAAAALLCLLWILLLVLLCKKRQGDFG